MATRLQKYNGKNHKNNKVIVDIKNKKVNFEPIEMDKDEHNGDLISYYFMFSTNHYQIFFRLWLYFIVVLVIDDYIKGFDNGGVVFGKAAFSLFVIYAMSFIFGSVFFNKWFRENVYPKANVGLFVIRDAFSFKDSFKRETYSYKQLSKKFVINDFNNVYLKYKVTGDVSKQLSKIKIEPKTKYDNGKWFLKFLFNRKPINGDLEVTYIGSD